MNLGSSVVVVVEPKNKKVPKRFWATSSIGTCGCALSKSGGEVPTSCCTTLKMLQKAVGELAYGLDV